jgi:hypothetical protein
MKKLSYITLFFIIFLVSGCFNKITESAPPPPPKVYPKEANFLEEMGLGDTVHIFIKQSGYFNPDSRSAYSTHLTCYTRLEVCRIDTFLYQAKKYYAVPGGISQSGPNFEFDTVKFDLKKALDACGQLEPFCADERQISSYVSGNNCLIWVCCDNDNLKKLLWRNFISLGMSDKSYQEWRFNPPNYKEIDTWRNSMKMNEAKPFWRYEVLSFYKDTCKIAYSDKVPIPLPKDFSGLR